jgi:hypothetical protein
MQQEKKPNIKKNSGLILLSIALVAFLVNYFFVKNEEGKNIMFFFITLSFILGIILVFPDEVIFDNKEYIKNKNLEDLVEKIRLRALMLNNLSVGIFFATLLVIIAGFYFLTRPAIPANDGSALSVNLTIRIGSSVLLIFLVQILFRVFKYLLRVAAFYNAKADALELDKMDSTLGLEKLSKILTPDNYDISICHNLL